MCLGTRRIVQALHISNHPRVLLISQKPTSDALLCDVSVGPIRDIVLCEMNDAAI
jgi:hypothetical protein